LHNAAVNAENRTVSPLPLEVVDTGGLPKHWIQVCTNDIYYSDGVCYAAALTEAGVEVKLDVVSGWPHTFVITQFFLLVPYTVFCPSLSHQL
jgi:acetyl esterase/lipase